MKELKDKINEYIPNKDKFYEWLLRQKFFLPNPKCNIMTVRFMDMIARHIVYMPKVNECRPVKIARPPSRKEL